MWIGSPLSSDEKARAERGRGFLSRQRGVKLGKDDKLLKSCCFPWSCVSSCLAGITSISYPEWSVLLIVSSSSHHDSLITLAVI